MKYKRQFSSNSVVSIKLFVPISWKFVQVLDIPKDLSFADFSVSVCGNLYQLLPVDPLTIYSEIENINHWTIYKVNSSGLCHSFQIAELTEWEKSLNERITIVNG